MTIIHQIPTPAHLPWAHRCSFLLRAVLRRSILISTTSLSVQEHRLFVLRTIPVQPADSTATVLLHLLQLFSTIWNLAATRIPEISIMYPAEHSRIIMSLLPGQEILMELMLSINSCSLRARPTLLRQAKHRPLIIHWWLREVVATA